MPGQYMGGGSRPLRQGLGGNRRLYILNHKEALDPSLMIKDRKGYIVLNFLGSRQSKISREKS